MTRWGPDGEVLPEPPGQIRPGRLPTRAEVLAELRALLPGIQDRLPLGGMVLFGSYAREEQTPQSDVDIALIEGPTALGLLDQLNLQDDLTEALGVRVDFVWLRLIKPLIRERVDREGIPI